MSAIKKIQRSGQALYASGLMKKIIAADTIIEVFARYNIDGSRLIPPWKKLLDVSKNKQNLIHYLCQCLTVACEGLPRTHQENTLSHRHWK